MVAALAVLPVVVAEQVAVSGWMTLLGALNWLIWAEFAAEFVVIVSLTDDRRMRGRRGWI